jgi:hypothetical protein
MSRREQLWSALLLLAPLWLAVYQRSQAAPLPQPPAPVCDVMAPEREFRTCVAGQAAAALELRAVTGKQYGDLLAELNAVKAELATRPTAQQVADTAWQKSSDRLDLWKRESAAYTDKWFYDEVYKRWRTHECRNGTPPAVGCP